MKIAVTGASGHVGTNLCRMLIEEGFSVKALIHSSTLGLENLDLELVRGDINSESDLKNLCRGCETVFNLAACISIRRKDDACIRTNAESCVTLISAAKSEGVRRIIHFSSIHAFNHEPMNHILDETRELALDSTASYDRSKALGQKIMLDASSSELEVVVLNPTAIVGPCDYKPSLIGNAVIRFYKGQNPTLIPGGYNWVDVRDICRAAINSINKGRPGQCYLLGGSWQSLETLAGAISQLGGHKVPAITLPMWLAGVGAIFLNLHATVSGTTPLYTPMSLEALKFGHRNISSLKAAKELEFVSRPFAQTMTDTISWFRQIRYI
ncbi:MAG: NAD-dependent epimerase/dehydratase family protein [Bacteroidales bacterium]|jgi:dihydroflavonol-4-reductase|nr:NAD-dependent epimerase/dehydratase family protein [Bacteroidales bacterium]